MVIVNKDLDNGPMQFNVSVLIILVFPVLIIFWQDGN